MQKIYLVVLFFHLLFFIEAKTVFSGVGQCSQLQNQLDKNYDAIEKILDLYQRPFTMLDVGAAQGYYLLRAAGKHPQSVFVMIEGGCSGIPPIGDHLLSLCKCNDQLKNIVLLKKYPIIDDLIRLGECEHFDIVLATNIINWLSDAWANEIEAVLKLGDNIIIEVPFVERVMAKKISMYLYKKNALFIGEFLPSFETNSSSQLFFIQNKQKKKFLKRSNWILDNPPNRYEIISDFKIKIMKRILHDDVVLWVPGINMMTFKMYQGAYPFPESLKQQAVLLKDEEHTDWVPNNFIVQGNKLKMIDANDSRLSYINPKLKKTYQKLKYMLFFLEENDPEKIKALFWKIHGASR